jgi:hypothetical protein
MAANVTVPGSTPDPSRLKKPRQQTVPSTFMATTSFDHLRISSEYGRRSMTMCHYQSDVNILSTITKSNGSKCDCAGVDPSPLSIEKAATPNRSIHFYGNDFIRPSPNFLRIWKTINEYVSLSI